MKLKELELLKQRVLNFDGISDEEKKRVMKAINNGQESDFKTGYATIDKPWEQFFIKEEFDKKQKNSKTIYQEVYDRNIEYINDLAIMYFGKKVKYDELFKRIESTAKSLEEYGIKKGDFVTVCCAGIPELIYTFYALAKIGAVSNLMAPYFDKKDMIERINDCESDTLIVMDKFHDAIKDSIDKSSIKKTIVIPTLNSSPLRFLPNKNKIKLNYRNETWWNQFIKDGKAREESSTMDYENKFPLCMVYSSGTTGASKAILLTHDSFQNSVLAYPASGVDISRNQLFYQIIPPWYSTGLNTSIHLPLFCGMTVLQDPRFERDVFVKNIVKYGVDYVVAPTSMYEGFLDDKLLKNKRISKLTYPFEGGEPLNKEVMGRIEKKLSEHGCDTKIRVAYGQCECGAAITTQTQKINHPDGSVGIPLPGVNVGIFDDNFKEQPYNVRGQILVDTPCGMTEYYKNPEATKKFFHIDDYGTKWSCTGDIGFMAENGDLFIEGRANDFSLINNKKIYNFDIEKVISKEKTIKTCDVIQGANWDVCAHIILEDNKLLNEDEESKKFLKHIQEKIYEEYGDLDMVPNCFKIRDSFPYKPFGKRDIEKLKNEKDGFVYIDKEELVNNQKKYIK